MTRKKMMQGLALGAAALGAYAVVKHMTSPAGDKHVAGWHAGPWWAERQDRGWGWGHRHHHRDYDFGYDDYQLPAAQPHQTWLYGGGTTNPYDPYAQHPQYGGTSWY